MTALIIATSWIALSVLFAVGHMRWHDHLARIDPHGAEQD